ncbi:D-2-hydroxyacid dehydrogenase [Clostridium sp. 19966]|uniref:D-2-hydroxyacid dehydrogenase n=1 Tax=Clostridium sp. 19966 TaxID=2768166 RepID=UPI0028DFE257|nr:D-2-hydroxyacid dehydrogenase [Clostridium sp. 19966]MDT8716308.1 D-2-hydroxyacid dehydrogenase [Clostridium sp. 19966]
MKIVVLDGYTLNPGDLSWDGFRNLGDVTIYDRTDSTETYERSKDAEIVITNKTIIDKKLIDKLTKLKYIGVLATGYNVVDVSAAKKKNVIVTNIPAYGTDSVAQMIFALILDITNHVSSHNAAVRQGAWSKSKDFCFWNKPIIELSGKTIGIIGFGAIGRKVADIAQVFDMNVIAYSRTITDESKRKNFKWVSLNSIFEESDFLSLNCPLNNATKGIINRDTLNKMKKNAILINASRGPLIVEEHLAEALNKGTISAAGLDVLSEEPPSKDNPLIKAKNCVLTPHIAWAAKEARMRLMNIAVSNLKAFLNGNPENIIES